MKPIYNTIFLAVLFFPTIVLSGVAPSDSVGDQAVEKYDSSVLFYASDKTAEITFERHKPVFGLENNRASASFLFNEERDNAITGAIMFDAKPSFLDGIELSFGTRAYAGLLSVENNDVFGLAASIGASYVLPIQDFPLKMSAEWSYAPDILTFGQSDRIFDWNVRAGLPLAKNINGFVGFRFLQFDTRPGDRELDKRVHIGIRWQ